MNRLGQTWRLIEETSEGDVFVSLCLITCAVVGENRYDGLVLDDAYLPDIGQITMMDRAEAFNESSVVHAGSRFRWERVA